MVFVSYLYYRFSFYVSPFIFSLTSSDTVLLIVSYCTWRFLKHDTVDMVSYVHWYIICSGMPKRFARHVVVNNLPIDSKVFEDYVANRVFFVVARDDGQSTV